MAAVSQTKRVTVTKAWAIICGGTADGLFATVQHHQGAAVELYYGPTASVPPVSAEGFMLYARGVHGGGAGEQIGPITLLAADSIWARAPTTDDTTKVNVLIRSA